MIEYTNPVTQKLCRKAKKEFVNMQEPHKQETYKKLIDLVNNAMYAQFHKKVSPQVIQEHTITLNRAIHIASEEQFYIGPFFKLYLQKLKDHMAANSHKKIKEADDLTQEQEQDALNTMGEIVQIIAFERQARKWAKAAQKRIDADFWVDLLIRDFGIARLDAEKEINKLGLQTLNNQLSKTLHGE